MDSEIDYEVVFKALVAPLLLLTPDFVVVAANDSYLKVTGRRRADLLGRHFFTVFPGNPNALNDPDMQGADCLRASLERVVATGERDTMALQRYDIEASGSPGAFEERYWSTINMPILGPDGEVKLIIHRSEEVTGFLQLLRRSGEHGLISARAEVEALEADVYVRARELQDLNERLQQAQRQQRQTASALRETIERERRFVFDASHDLRNPITGLLTELEVALSGPDTGLQQILRKLLRGAERLDDIVADLLELARLDTAAPAATEPVDLGRLVVEELERRTLTTTVLARLDQQVVVHASRIRLARLLANLLANAERHTTTVIEIIVTTAPPDAVLEVIDDGPGIAPADRERVFERLCRLEDACHRDPGGSGLGLPIAREIAESHGGHLYAADHPTGARFVLRLPLAA
ncbi:Signal transduction histidine kinase [Streptosporangium subroseum]|uniref:histidine kinase n=1 Tax=Streptosporangium subroseum TaxID=106412 RepID=A0A239DWL1_9ACTN|nr:PAS domain-containing sensor histidine kinase [Streptosporangium subroseum]SNS36511.1 Signal transduction histidine kinase [Streptosporangium subroseum]